MFSYSTGYYVSPPDDQYLKFKNRCSLLWIPPREESNKHASPETRHASAAPTGHQHVRGARLWHQYAGEPQSVRPGLLPPTLLWTNCNRWFAITVTALAVLIKVKGICAFVRGWRECSEKNKNQLFSGEKACASDKKTDQRVTISTKHFYTII